MGAAMPNPDLTAPIPSAAADPLDIDAILAAYEGPVPRRLRREHVFQPARPASVFGKRVFPVTQRFQQPFLKEKKWSQDVE